MTREEAESAMNKMLDEAAAKGVDRNVETLRYTNKALRRGMLPPEQRPDSGNLRDEMAPAEMNPVQLVSNALTDARRIVDNFEKDTKELESKLLRMEDEIIRLESERAQLHAQFDAERTARISLEKQIAQIVDLVSPR
jgi:vacuolar-type H+-ATPase subunit H